MKVLGIIPARYKSSRFPGKPLADICGKPMIWWVYNRAIKAETLTEVYVATDDERIYNACKENDINVIMTSDTHKTGTDRIGEVARKIPADLYVNIQGDEPMIEPETINKAVYPFFENPDLQITNLMTKIKDPVDVVNFTVPKVITNADNIGVYLTRSTAPYPKGSIDYSYYKQVCVYGFKPEALQFYCSSPRGKIESIEDIEILRFIEAGYRVQYIEVDSETVAVDTQNSVALYWRELQAADLSKVTLVDVRTPDEFALGALKGAVNIPLDDMRERMKEIPQDKPVYLYCGVGLRGYLASNILLQNGFGEVRNLIGGLKLYKAATAPLPKPKEFSNSGSSSSDSSKVDHSEHSKDSAEAYTIASSVIPSMKAIKVDACGISCPGPIMKLKKSMEELADGERLEIVATDAGFPRDAEAWCQTTGNRFVSVKSGAGKYEVIVEKSTPQSSSSEVCREDKGKTFILFSDDLDKVLATFVLANGAAATGKKVTIFFTFWGLNAIKRLDKPAVKKDIWGKMFGMMLPSSSLKLRLSKMNMGGMGARMMRYIMNKKNIDSLESLRTQAIQNGVEFIACQMSMDVMGVKREELLDHVTIGGVATYMNRAEQANVNLFI